MQPFRDWIFKEVISENEVTRVGLNPMCPPMKRRLEEIRTQTCTKGRHRETVASVSQGERPREKLSLSTL